jgi:hypothetical protein
MTNYGDGTFGSDAYGGGAVPAPQPVDVQTAKTELRAQIMAWRGEGWPWDKIKSREGKHVWSAYRALGGT